MMRASNIYEGQCVLVLGLGISGRSAAHFLIQKGAKVVGADRTDTHRLMADREIGELCEKGMVIIDDKQALDLRNFNLVVVSPGISNVHPLYKAAIDKGIEVIGEVELACRSIVNPCAAVTGTNGKTTVTLLIAHVLNHAGIPSTALGNVGRPLTLGVDQSQEDKHEMFVVELSSFQLDTMKCKFADAGVILNITPDHLDRYGTMENYAQSKIHLRNCLKSSGKLFVENKCLKEYSEYFSGSQPLAYGYTADCYIRSDQQRVFVGNLEAFVLPPEYHGKANHDVDNLMAAYAICREAGISGEEFLSGLKTFKKPSHRIEFVQTVLGVHYFDDSKGTNIDAVIKAVDALDGKVILIAGGVDKGMSYTSWLSTMGNKLKLICAIGNAAKKIERELGSTIPVRLCETLDDAVTYASTVAKPGENVLLSPGCSSYDMFKDYAHRGEVFQSLVKALKLIKGESR